MNILFKSSDKYSFFTDAKLETMKELFAATDEKGWLGFNRLLDSNIRKTSEF